MKHITIIKSKDNLIDQVIVTVTGNSFGDQILELKQYIINGYSHYYDTIHSDSFPEGNHLSIADIKDWAWINLQ